MENERKKEKKKLFGLNNQNRKKGRGTKNNSPMKLSELKNHRNCGRFNCTLKRIT